MNKFALIVLMILCGCATQKEPPIPKDSPKLRRATALTSTADVLQEFTTDNGIEIYTQSGNVLLRFMHPEDWLDDRSKDPVFIEWSSDLVNWNLDYYLLYPGTVFLDRDVMKTNAFMFYRIRGLRSDY